jgi:DNA-binding protein H-NS
MPPYWLCYRRNNQISVVSNLEQDEIACFPPQSLSNYTVSGPEITMPKIDLSEMNVEALMDLRERVDGLLSERRAELQEQLERIAGPGSGRVVRGGGSALKGRKVPPKYRGPSGETWAGRGARPRWLVAAIKGGKKPDDFLIDKSARKGRRKHRSKR